MNALRPVALAAVVSMVACGAPVAEQPGAASGPAEERPVSPSDFAVQSCGPEGARAPCALVRAGGKTLVFGAPEGITGVIARHGAGLVDGVFLTSLRSGEMEGLIRLRSETWAGGRRTRLALTGPAGTAEMAARLDSALEYADAVAYLERRPAGDYDAALIQPREVSSPAPVRVFDTGDLIVSAQAARGGEVLYTIGYGARLLQIAPCALAGEPAPETIDLRLSCTGPGEGLAFPGEAVQIILND